MCEEVACAEAEGVGAVLLLVVPWGECALVLVESAGEEAVFEGVFDGFDA